MILLDSKGGVRDVPVLLGCEQVKVTADSSSSELQMGLGQLKPGEAHGRQASVRAQPRQLCSKKMGAQGEAEKWSVDQKSLSVGKEQDSEAARRQPQSEQASLV